MHIIVWHLCTARTHNKAALIEPKHKNWGNLLWICSSGIASRYQAVAAAVDFMYTSYKYYKPSATAKFCFKLRFSHKNKIKILETASQKHIWSQQKKSVRLRFLCYFALFSIRRLRLLLLVSRKSTNNIEFQFIWVMSYCYIL